MGDRADEELHEAVLELKSGSASAVQRVYQLTGSRIYGKLLALLKEPPLARAALLSTYLRLWQDRASIHVETCDPFHFIAAVAHRSALDIRFRTTKSASVIDGRTVGVEAHRHAVEGIALQNLDETDREMLTAAYLQFESVEAIAERLDLPPETVRARLTRLTGRGGGHDG